MCGMTVQSVQSDCDSDAEIIFVTYSEATGSSTILVSWGGAEAAPSMEGREGKRGEGRKGKGGGRKEERKGKEKNCCIC